MTKLEKLLQKLLDDRSLSFDEVDTLLQANGFMVDVTGSHHIYRNPSGCRVVIPKHGKEVKKVYLKQVREVLNGEK